MLSYERQNQILELLKEHQCVTVPFLCKKLYSSGATIRRDLTEMNEKGLIARVRGGAALMEGTNQDAPYMVRSNQDIEKKKIIMNLALSYVTDSETLFMDSSSTVTFLATKLNQFRNLSIVTNGIATSNVLNDYSSAKVFLCGGMIKNNSSTVGQIAIDSIHNFRADKLFFSCCGISLEAGLTEANEDNTAVKRQMLKNSKMHILLCDSSKFHQEFFCKSCDISGIDLIITDQKPDDAFLHTLPVTTKIVYPKTK